MLSISLSTITTAATRLSHFNTRSASYIWKQSQRHKVTLVNQDFTEDTLVKRPLPVVFVQSHCDYDKSWPPRWQKKLIDLGYRSSWIHLEKNQEGTTHTQQQTLDVWYKDLVQAMQEHSYFPPLLIGHGVAAWRTCQKYVSNKPVSGLVLIYADNDDEKEEELYPSMEFEPYFPLLVISPKDKVPLFLQNEQVDHVDFKNDSNNGNDVSLQHTLKWMDDINM